MNKILQTSKLSATILVCLAILIALNVAAHFWFKRWDLTANQLYSLSSVSAETVKDLEHEMSIEVLFGPELPSQYLLLQQTVNDVLAEYANYSGKITVKSVEPENIEEKATALKLPKVQFNTLRKDKLEVLNGYLGLSLTYQGKTEVIPVVESTSNLEYQLTALMQKLSQPQRPIIGWVTSNGVVDINQESQLAYQEVSQLYEVKTVDLTAPEPIDTNIKTLIIVGPKASLNEAELKKIDDFILSGKSVLMLLDKVDIVANLAFHVSANNLDVLLARYGLQLKDQLLLDNTNAVAPFNQGFLTFNVNYPFWPKITKANFDQSLPAVAQLEGVVLPWATGLATNDALPGSTKVQWLAKTSNEAWVKSGDFNLMPNQNLYANEPLGQYNVAMALSGLTNKDSQVSNAESKLIVVADSDFIKDSIAQRYPANLLFFQNLVDHLTLDANLAEIRSKEITDRPIKELSTAHKRWLRYGNVFGLTALVIIFGLARYYWRRKFNNFSL